MTEFQSKVKRVLEGRRQSPARSIAVSLYATCEPTHHQVLAVRRALKALGAEKLSRWGHEDLYFLRPPRPVYTKSPSPKRVIVKPRTRIVRRAV